MHHRRARQLRGTNTRQLLERYIDRLVVPLQPRQQPNQYLGRRMADGLLRRVLPGDGMAKLPFGGMFVAEDVAAEQARFDRREIVPAGPIFGRKTFPAKQEAAEREAAVLQEAGLARESFARRIVPFGRESARVNSEKTFIKGSMASPF